MFIELLTAIGIGASALPSDASEPTPIIDYPDPTEVMCLAENMYHEAKNQGTAGWSAVASVTFNRIRDSRFPNTVCEVVKQGLLESLGKQDYLTYQTKKENIILYDIDVSSVGTVMVSQMRYQVLMEISFN